MNSKQRAVPAGTSTSRASISALFPLVAAVFAAALVVAAGGWMAGLRGFDDPDSAMRLVEVREFLAGKPWFDLLETRLAPPAGVFMHWSRLVDVPIALLILVFEPLVGRPSAELLAMNLWPPLTFLAFGAGVVAIVRRFSDGLPVIAALALILASPIAVGIFRPGRIDHHNVQAALLVWTVFLLMRAEQRPLSAAGAGVLTAASVAVGLEMMPLLLVMIAVLALAWIHDGDRWRRAVTAFGAALGLAVPAFYVLGVGPDRWMIASCDAISIVYAALGAVGGLALVTVANLFRGGPSDGPAGLLVRGGAMLGAGCLILTMTAVAFPVCLGGPYAEVDPRLGPIWLDHVIEAWSALEIYRREPWMLASNYGTVVAALVAVAITARLAPPRYRFALALIAGVLGGAVALGFLQQRSLVAAQTFAAIGAASASVVLARDVVRAGHPAIPLLRNGWVLFAPLVWAIIGTFGEPRDTAMAEAAAGKAETACYGTFGDVLASQPAGLIVAPSNYGAYLLMQTPSTVLAAPYHRNTEGLLAADAIFTASDGRRAFEASGARYLALCPGDPETALLRSRAPVGLAARLADGERPDWLEPLADSPAGLVFRRRDTAAGVDPDRLATGSLAPLSLRPSLD